MDLQRWLKRFRKAIEPRKIRYYACGEYGEKDFRPHYHLLLFGSKPCSCIENKIDPFRQCNCKNDRKIISETWGEGGVPRLGTVTQESARYVADYIGKALIAKDAMHLTTWAPLEAPFIRMSQGIARDFVDQNAEQIRRQKVVTVKGVPVGLPRYYALRLGIEAEKTELGATHTRPGRWIGQKRNDTSAIDMARVQSDENKKAKVQKTKKGTL